MNIKIHCIISRRCILYVCAPSSDRNGKCLLHTADFRFIFRIIYTMFCTLLSLSDNDLWFHCQKFSSADRSSYGDRRSLGFCKYFSNRITVNFDIESSIILHAIFTTLLTWCSRRTITLYIFRHLLNVRA